MYSSAVSDPDGGYVTPQFRVYEGVWYVSYDNGNSWKEIEGGSEQGKSMFTSIEITEDYIIFTLADGSEFTIPTTTSLPDGVEDIYATSYGVVPGVVDMTKMDKLLADAVGKTIRFNDGEYIFPAHIKVPSDISFIGNTTTVFKLAEDSKSNVLFPLTRTTQLNTTIHSVLATIPRNRQQPYGRLYSCLRR